MPYKTTTVAVLIVTSAGHAQTVRGFDAADELTHSLPLPVAVKFDHFERR